MHMPARPANAPRLLLLFRRWTSCVSYVPETSPMVRAGDMGRPGRPAAMPSVAIHRGAEIVRLARGWDHPGQLAAFMQSLAMRA